MANLPADRTKLNVAVANQQPSIVASAQANREALIESYDTIDLLDQKVNNMVANGTLSPYPAFLSRQAVINGNFDVWQRGTSFNATGGNVFTADRWSTFNNITSQASTISRQDGSGVNGSIYCLRYQRNSGQTGTNSMFLAQSLETNESKKFIGKKLTLSFWARIGSGASSSSLTAIIASGTGTDQNIIQGLTGQVTESIGTFTLTTAWQKFTVTSAEIANTKTQLAVRFNYTPVGTAGTNDYFEVAQVQLCAGDVALPYQPRSFAEELALCLRYFEKNYDYATALGSNTDSGSVQYTQSTAELNYSVPFKSTKRTNPTVTIYAKAGTVSKVTNVTDSIEVTIGGVVSGTTGFIVYGAATANKRYQFSYAADAEL